MYRFLISIRFVCLAGMLITCSVAGLAQPGSSWAPLGTAGFSTGVADYTSMTVSRQDSSLYVAFKDIANGNKVTVMRSTNGGAWTLVGTAGFSGGAVDHVSIAVHDGKPMVAFKDYQYAGRLSIMRWSGTAWGYVGNPGAQSFGEVNAVSLCVVGARDRFMVAYTDEADGNKVYVRMKAEGFNGAFSPVGATAASTGAASFLKVAADEYFGVGFIVYTDSTAGAKATVREFDGTNWVSLGGTSATPGVGTHNDIAVNTAGQPVIVYRDGNNSNRASVRQWTGTAWTQLGTAGFSAGTAEFNSIVIDTDNRPIVAYKDGNSNGRATARRFNGSSWAAYGAVGFTSGSAEFIELAASGNYGPFMVCKDVGLSGKIVVESYACTNPSVPSISPNGGSFCGGEGILLSTAAQTNTQMRWYRTLTAATLDSVGTSRTVSATNAERVAIAFDKAGTLHYAFIRYGDVFVVRRTSNGWQTLGGGPATTDAEELDIAIDPTNNDVYLATEDNYGSHAIRVKKFTGTTWQAFQSPEQINTTAVNLAFSSAGSLYLATSRATFNTQKLGVYRLDGNTWTFAGQSAAAGAAPTINHSSLAISSAGTPMVSTTGGNVYFNTLNRTPPPNAEPEWRFKSASTINSTFSRIAISRTDQVFIAFINANNGRLTALRRSGNAQDTTGTFTQLGAEVSAGTVNRFDMAVDNDGIPYLVYIDASLGHKTQLKRWNGSAWETAGGASFSVGVGEDPKLAFDLNNNAHVLYIDNSLEQRATLVLPDRKFLQASTSLNANRGGGYLVAANAGCFANVLSNIVTLTQTDQYNTWIGGVNGAWATAGNWSCGRLPTTNDVVRIPATPGAIYPFAQGSTTAFVCAGLVMEPGARLDINGDAALRIFGTLDLRGNARINTIGTVRVLVAGGIN